MYILSAERIVANRDLLHELLSTSTKLSQGDYTADDLIESALNGGVSLITTSRTEIPVIAAVDIYETFRNKYVMVLALSGQVELIYNSQHVFDWWAKALGCTEVRMACQDSRERLFRRRGFKKMYNICSYKIGERT